jgi:hypothetical protein
VSERSFINLQLTVLPAKAAVWVGSLMLLLTWGCSKSHPNQTNPDTRGQDQFHWLDVSRDSTVWNDVQTAFHQELAPDDPLKVPLHYAAYQFKYVYQIGVFRAAALVIVGYRETEDSPGYDYFNAYSYDLREGSKRAIVTEPPRPPGSWPQSDVLMLFEVIKLARFEPSLAPDVVFTYSGCTECEGDHFLASFEYDRVSRSWTARQWDKESSLLLAFDPSPGDNVLSSEYLFKIKDWNGDGFDDVAVRRRKVTQVGKRRNETEDSTVIYSAEKGRVVGHPVTDAKEREGINAELCSDSELTFCQEHK